MCFKISSLYQINLFTQKSLLELKIDLVLRLSPNNLYDFYTLRIYKWKSYRFKGYLTLYTMILVSILQNEKKI